MARGRWLVWLLMAAVACADATPPSTAVCDARVFRTERLVLSLNPIDLLFVIDAGPSMAQEREHFLAAQLPAAVDLLLGGKTAEGATLGLPTDLHIGVISADMGVGPNGAVAGCSAAGDAGLLRNADVCGTSQPKFDWYYQGRDDRDATAAAVRCMADVGASGCSISQPLEAALAALGPASGNAGFVRSGDLTSLIAIVILTDSDDCSTHDPTLFGLDAALGCIRDPLKLRAVQSYVSGLRALRPEQEYLVEVGIIAGVPPALISRWKEAGDEVPLRDYDALLADPSMQPRFSGPNSTELLPSCSSATASASPPRRLVQFARDFGPGAFVRSICDYDLAALLFDMLFTSSRFAPSESVCLGPRVISDSRGFVPCRMTWELPEVADPNQPLTPTRCEERPGLLSVPSAGFPTRSDRGRVLCEVHQTAATRDADGSLIPVDEGFYYNPAAASQCFSRTQSSPLTFTPRAYPPGGIVIAIECVDEGQRARPPGSALIGESCQPPGTTAIGSDSLCGNPMGDHSPGKLLCHPELNRCVMACDEDAQCPTEWACAASGSLTTRVCVRPQCER